MQVFAEDGVVYVSFAMNRGKGSGAQVIPVDQLPDYIDALDHFARNGVEETVEQNYSAAETVRRTIALEEDGTLSFRARSGKGAKPARIAPDQLSSVTALLREVSPRIEAGAKKLARSK
jgi:hypothetical protein